MDILKYGPDCEVLDPKELRARVCEQAAATLALYRNASPEVMKSPREIRDCPMQPAIPG